MAPRADTDIATVVATAARTLETDLADRGAELVAHLFDEIPALNGDEAIGELMAASVSSNLSTILDVLTHGIPVDRIEVPAAAAAYARRLAQRELPVEALLRAYRLGEARFVDWWLDAAGAVAPDTATLLAATRAGTSVTSRYIDRVSEHLIEIYGAERRLWAQRTAAARAVQVRTVLGDPSVDLGTAEAMLGCVVQGPHRGFVAWTDAAITDTAPLDAAVAAVGEAGARPALAVPADETTTWGWLSGPDAACALDGLDAAVGRRAGLRVALGEPADDLAGFRATHLEAVRAKAVAERSLGAPAPTTRFAEVSIAAFLAEDIDGVRTWVARTLGPLGRDDEATAKLRETVRIFLETGGSFLETARRMHLHKNTVHYRVRRAEEIRGGTLGEARLDVEVALVACDRLGRSVLS